MNFKLESKRLILRTLNQEWACQVCEFYKKNYEWLSPWEPNLSKHFFSAEVTEKFMKAEFKSMLSGNCLRYWFSSKSLPDRLIGSVNFQNIRKGNFSSCQIGYKIDKEFSGFGFTAEAVSCAISSLFDDEGLHRIEALIVTDNLPSIRLAENVGFVKEGIARERVRVNNEWKDCYQYSLLNGELKN